MDSNTLVSAVVVLKNQADIVEALIDECLSVLSANYLHHELVLVDNGSADATRDKALAAMADRKNVRLLALSQEYDEELAQYAGLENAIGDFVVALEADFDPPALIPLMVEECRKGYDVIIGRQRSRAQEPLPYRIMAALFYRIFSLLVDQPIQTEWSNYVCLSRKAVNAIIQVKDRVRYLKYLSASMGCRTGSLAYDRIHRTNRARRKDFRKSLHFALDVMAASSDTLMRSATLLSFGFSLLSALYILYALGVLLLVRDVAAGWTSISLVLATLFCALFFILAILCQYVGLMSKENKKGPLYQIADEISCSQLFKDFEERNVSAS